MDSVLRGVITSQIHDCFLFLIWRMQEGHIKKRPSLEEALKEAREGYAKQYDECNED